MDAAVFRPTWISGGRNLCFFPEIFAQIKDSNQNTRQIIPPGKDRWLATPLYWFFMATNHHLFGVAKQQKSIQEAHQILSQRFFHPGNVLKPPCMTLFFKKWRWLFLRDQTCSFRVGFGIASLGRKIDCWHALFPLKGKAPWTDSISTRV